MEPFEADKLTLALESLRPAPRPAFAAELDERAAAGFPRPATDASSPLGRLRAWLEAIPPRRALLPAGVTALAAVAAVTVVMAVGESEDKSTSRYLRPLESGAAETATPQAATPNADAAKAQGEVAGGSVRPFSSSGESSGIEYRDAPPTDRAAGFAGSASGGGSAAGSSTGPYAARAAHREVERSAEIVLGTDPAGVSDAAADVFGAVHAYDGIVLRSSVSGGDDAGAEFDLLIPSAKLGDALAAFSGIAEVVSRHEATADITAPTVRVGERLQDSRATIDGLLAELAAADTAAEREAVEAELRGERRQAAALRSQRSSLERRANFSRVSLRIEADGGSGSGAGGGWGIDDALGDAGHILGIAAAVTLVGLAILAPLALIALLAWLASRAWVRRGRARALQ